ncbi:MULTISPECIES: hypothetical protein [Streptomyces]|uniref:Uncharacterized protein n=1 Tax=Streptomyces viridochromogenes TaxID=1938 RepID=A0A0L8JLK5_STRVR|nr:MULTISPECIES: hypothetical protein [Streptomyces]KOG14517.1 hypothetical protein ADK34_29015 [Streptomyces viridochromogenes]
MAKTPDDLSTEIADLKKALFEEAKQEVKYKIENTDDKTKEDKPFVETTSAVASALKKHLIDVTPKIATENFLLPVIAQIKEIHTEVTKNKNVELLEATPFLGGIAAAWEKWYESKEPGADVKWQHWLAAALAGLALVTLLPGIRGAIVNGFRYVSTKRRGDTPALRDQKLIWTKNADGGWGRETLGAVKAREARKWNGGTSLADIVQDGTNAARAEALTQKLGPLNGELLKFNNRAPDFLRHFGRMPTPGKAQKAVEALQKIADAIGRINLTAFSTVANSIGRIVDHTGKANPLHVTQVAEGIGKLVLAAKDFKPEMIPKAGPVRDSASALETLTGKIQPLQNALRELRSETGRLNSTLDGN